MTRLEAFLRKGGWTQERMGEQLGCQQSQVSRYCKAVSQPRPPVAARLSDLTHGVIHLGNYADDITDAEAADMMAEIARREAAGATAQAPGKTGEVS